MISQQKTKELLSLLDQENLCLTISLHKDKVFANGKTLMDLLTDEKKLAAETFMKCGRSSVTDGSGDQLIEKLVDAQYESFRTIQNLQPDFDYV